MKRLNLSLSVAVLSLLAACAGPAPTPPAAAPVTVSTPVSQFAHSELNDAASAYVSLYKNTVERSLALQQYRGDLAFKHLSAEACLDSRATRLLSQPLAREQKDALLRTHVPAEQLKAFEQLARGHYTRVNGLEVLSCDVAGVKVAQHSGVR